MQVNSLLAASAETSRRPSASSRRVVDAPTRMFHWLFALSFVGAYVTAESERWRLIHVILGYTLAGLLAFRLIYGLVGPQPARLSLLWRRLKAIPGWIAALSREAALSAAAWRQGQPLAMGVPIAAVLMLVVPLTLSGYASYNDWGGEWLEEVHEFFGNAFLLAVLAHVAVVAVLSILRRRNLVIPMITGRAPGAGPDLVSKNRAWLASLMLLVVIGFGAWQWQQVPTPTGDGAATSRVHPDDDD